MIATFQPYPTSWQFKNASRTIPSISRLPGICRQSWDKPRYPCHGPWLQVDIMGLGVILVPTSPPDPLYRLRTRTHGHPHSHHIDFEPGPWDSRRPGCAGNPTGLRVILAPISPPDPWYRFWFSAHDHSHTHHTNFEPGPWDCRLPGIRPESWDIPGYPGHVPWFKVDVVGLGLTLVPMSPPDALYRLWARAHGHPQTHHTDFEPGRDMSGVLGYPGIFRAWAPGSKSI